MEDEIPAAAPCSRTTPEQVDWEVDYTAILLFIFLNKCSCSTVFCDFVYVYDSLLYSSTYQVPKCLLNESRRFGCSWDLHIIQHKDIVRTWQILCYTMPPKESYSIMMNHWIIAKQIRAVFPHGSVFHMSKISISIWQKIAWSISICFVVEGFWGMFYDV